MGYGNELTRRRVIGVGDWVVAGEVAEPVKPVDPFGVN